MCTGACSLCTTEAIETASRKDILGFFPFRSFGCHAPALLTTGALSRQKALLNYLQKPFRLVLPLPGFYVYISLVPCFQNGNRHISPTPFKGNAAGVALLLYQAKAFAPKKIRGSFDYFISGIGGIPCDMDHSSLFSCVAYTLTYILTVIPGAH